jgi:hypothetical protein
VNKLLLSTQPKNVPAGRRRRRRRGRYVAVVAGDGVAAVPRGGGRPALQATVAVGFVTWLVIGGMDRYAENHSAESLTRASVASVGLICLGLYSHALYKFAEEERRRGL